jgi:DamX protein
MSLHPDCLVELKLRYPPFDSLPTEDFVYTDDRLEALITSAGEAIEAPGAILMLTGEDGSGRSMQLMRLLGSLPDHYELIAFRARLNTQFEAVDFTIRNHLRAGGHDDPDRPLGDLLAGRIRAGFDPVIAVDDAHLLGMDLINILLRIRSDILSAEGRAPRLILAGDPVLLRRRLQLRSSDEQQTARFTLRPFSLEQTEAYLRHRLRAAGMPDHGVLLTEDVIADLQAESKGLPEGLNIYANEWLERLCRARMGKSAAAGSAPGTQSNAGEATTWQTSPTALGVTGDPPEKTSLDSTPNHEEPDDQSDRQREELNLAGLHADDEDRGPGPKQGEPERGPEASPIPFWGRTWFVPAVAALVAFLILAPFARHLFDRAPDSPVSTVELPLPVVPAPAPEPVEPEPAWEDPLAIAPGPGDDPRIVEVPFDDRPPAEMPPPDAAPEPPTPAPQPEPRPEPPAEPAPPPAPVEPPPAPVEPPPAPAEPPSAPAEPPSAPVQPPAAPVVPPAAAPTAGALAEDRAWLGRQDRSHFTIQLIAAQNAAAARSFVEGHGLTGIRLIPTQSGGREFVVALAGSFASRSAAEQALANLPEAVRAGQPWIRSIGSVQDIQR